MARAVALVPDLLFGSRLAGRARRRRTGARAGRRRGRGCARRWPAGRGPSRACWSSTSPTPSSTAPRSCETLRDEGLLAGARTLAFYSHVDAAARERAEDAGFDLVVPRSRMAREGAALVARLGA